MAEVARKTQPGSDVDYYLDYQLRMWGSVSEYAEWWPDMDAPQREAFHLEWIGMTESRLRELQQWAKQGLLTPAQYAWYEDLLRLVAEKRPALERLLAE